MRRILTASLLLIMLAGSNSASAQPDPPLFHLTQQIGRGHVQSLEWHPTDDVILISTIRGAWFYDGLLRDLGHIEDARLATFSPDGALVAGVNAANQITLWDSETYASAGTLAGHEALVTAMAWSPAGDLLATGDRTGNMIIWHVDQQREVSHWQLSKPIKTIAWNPDGTRLAVATTDSALSVYATVSARQVFNSPASICCGHDPAVDIAWIDSTTTGRLVFGKSDAEVEKWNVETGELISDQWSQVNPEHWISWGQPYEISSDANLLARSSIGAVEVINRATDSVLWEFEEPLWFLSRISWSHDNTRLIAVGVYSEIFLWDILTGIRLAENLNYAKPEPRPAWQMELGDPNIAGLPSWSSDSQFLAIPDRVTAVNVWDIATGKQTALLEGHDAPVVKVAWHSTENQLATIQDCWFYSNDYAVRIWNARTGSLIDTNSHGDCPRTAAWEPDGDALLSVSEADADVYVWDAVVQQLVQKKTIDSMNPDYGFSIAGFEGISWSPDSEHIVLTFPGGIGVVSELFDYPEFSPPDCFGNCYTYNHGHTFSIYRNYWSADGKQWIVVSWYRKDAIESYEICDGCDKFLVEITVPFNTQSDELIATTLHGHSAPIVEMAPDPSGTNLITLSEDSEARLWDVFTGQTLLVLSDVSRVAWSADGTLIGGFSVVDQLWHIYDAQHGAMVASLPVPSFEAGYLVWSPDSQKIAQIVGGVVFVWER